MEKFFNVLYERICKIFNIRRRKDTLNFNRRRGRRDLSTVRRVTIFVTEILGAVTLAFILSFTFFSGVTMAGFSMEDTLMPGDKIFINRTIAMFSPKNGDLVAFEVQSGQNRTISIKRIVAGPGDSVYISNGALYVNGEKEKPKIVDEEIIPIDDPGLAKNEIMLSKNEFFLLGDNRNSSEDSRYETIGVVNKSAILGKVWFCYSFSNFGPIS